MFEIIHCLARSNALKMATPSRDELNTGVDGLLSNLQGDSGAR